MKLKLALVALAAVVSTTAFAQEKAPATSAPAPERAKPTLQWYGVADVNAMLQNTGNGWYPSLGSGGFLSSRFGLRGEAPFADDFTAVYALEAGLTFDTANVGNAPASGGINNNKASSSGGDGTGSQLFARQAFAGVRSPWGTLTAGRQYNGSYLVVANLGMPFAGMFGYALALSTQGGLASRANNSVYYTSPTISGLRLMAGGYTGLENNTTGNVASGSASTNAKAGRGTDVSLWYSVGKLKAGAGGWYYYANTFAATETELAIKKGYDVAANYDFGPAALYGHFEQTRISGGKYELVTKTMSKAVLYSAGIKFSYGRNRLAFDYTNLNDQGALNKDAEVMGAHYWFDFTPKSHAYASYGYLINHRNSTYAMIDASDFVGVPVRPGADPRGFQTGFAQEF